MNVAAALVVGRRLNRLRAPFQSSSSSSSQWRTRRRRIYEDVPTSINSSSSNRRSLAVMVVGHGWTGALGTGRLDQYVPGHEEDYHEDYDDDDDDADEDVNNDESSTVVDPNLPVTIYDGGPVLMARPGWGHTAVITAAAHDNNNRRRLLLTGRPHDFQNLLRLHRMPEWMRYQIAKQTQSTSSSSSESSGGGSYLDRLLSFFMQNFGGAGPSTQQQSKSGQEENNTSSTDLMLADWQAAAEMSMLTSLTEIPLPEPPLAVACSAGLTAVVTNSGNHVYTFGINMFGQCGTGIVSNNIWQPTRVVTSSHYDPSFLQTTDLLEPGSNEDGGVNSSRNEENAIADNNTLAPFDDDEEGHDDEYYEQPFHDLKSITSIALGLQHAVCLNDNGQVFCFGKGDRGQLGQGKFLPLTPTAELVEQYCVLVRPPEPDDNEDDSSDNNDYDGYNPNPKPLYKPLGPVQKVAAGLLHTAALTKDDDHPQVLLWGKNVLAPLIGDKRDGKAASDANLPCQLHFPNASSSKVIDICCGSHHTAMLLEDGSVYGVGISSNSATKVPIHEPVMMIPPGIVEMPVRQFDAHFDRTTIVGASGQQVLQVHLMEEPNEEEGDVEAESSSLNTFFTPAWVDRLLDHDPTIRIQEVHRGWLHTVIVTDHDNEGDDGEKNDEDDKQISNTAS